MKVRMIQLLTGMVDGVRVPPPGGTFDVSDVVGADLCAQGIAEPVAEKPVERAEKRSKASKKVACPEDGCDYEGSERGLKVHAGHVHADGA